MSCLYDLTHATSRSIPTPPTLGRNSTAVTFDPNLLHTEPSSSPITPAPIRTNFSGTSSKQRAPVDDMIVFSSICGRGNKRKCSNITATQLQISTRNILIKQSGHYLETSTSIPGNGVTSDPVAMRIFFVWITSFPPSSVVTVTSLGELTEP